MTRLERLRAMRALGMSYRAAAVLLALTLGSVLFEGVGIAMLLPVFEFMQAGGNVAELAAGARHWAFLVDAFNAISVPVNLATLLAVSFGAIIARQIFNYLRLSYNAHVLYGAIHELRTRSFRLVLRTRTSEQEESELGAAVNDVAVELPKAINALYGTVALVGRILLILVYLGGLLFLAPWMTVVSVAVMGLTGFALSGLLRRSRAASEAITLANRNFTTFLLERLKSLRLIRLSGTENPEIDNLRRLSAAQRDNEVTMRKIAAKLDAFIEPTAILLGFVVLFLGYTYFNMPIGALGLFIVVMMRLLPATREVINAWQGVLGQWASLARITEGVRLMQEAREPRGGSVKFEHLNKDLRFDHVSYTYKGNSPALVDVTCEIPVRQLTALVGPSGSGKSTFIDLLPRLRDADSGSILIDGRPIADFSVDSLRDAIAFVPQHAQLFNVRVADHIGYGRPGASDAEVREAARLAGAADFIERLPGGYDMLLGEGGERLSGGQRQRLDLARALIRRAPILVLDEPTSHLDADSEQQLRAALARIRDQGETTIVIIAHRLSTIVEADRIIVFEQGRVTDCGTHHELVRRGRWYASAFSQQHGDNVERLQAATH